MASDRNGEEILISIVGYRSMFGLKIINVWEAWGIIVLCNLLFKSTSTNSKD